MDSATTKRLRSGARVPKDNSGTRYLGQQIEEQIAESGKAAFVSKTQKRILLAAVALFAERGYENCSMRAIADTVGLKAPTLYNYYASKEELLGSAMEYGMDDFFSYVLQDIERVPLEQRLFEVVRRHIRYKLLHRVITRANDRLIDPQFSKMFLSKETAGYFKKRLDTYRFLFHDLVAGYVAADQEIDPMVLTITIMNQCDHAAYWYHPDGKFEFEEVVEQLVKLTQRMLGAVETA